MADNSQRRAGLEEFDIDGTEYDLVSVDSWGVSSVTRTTLNGARRPQGYKEEAKAGFIAVTIRDAFGTTVRGFQEMTNVTASLLLGNGKRVTGTNMWTVEAAEVEGAEATFKLRLEGTDVREV